MDVRVITLRYQDALQGFSEEALRKAISGREEPAGGEVFCRSKAPDPEEGLYLYYQ